MYTHTQTHTPDSVCCTPETNTLKVNYSPIKIFLKDKENIKSNKAKATNNIP